MTKVALQQALMHFGNPVYVDTTNVKQKDQEAIVRFDSKECTDAFLTKAADHQKIEY